MPRRRRGAYAYSVRDFDHAVVIGFGHEMNFDKAKHSSIGQDALVNVTQNVT